jgi:hypothetical protein
MSSNKNNITMIRRKDTTNISEITGFFTSSEKVGRTVLWIQRKEALVKPEAYLKLSTLRRKPTIY